MQKDSMLTQQQKLYNEFIAKLTLLGAKQLTPKLWDIDTLLPANYDYASDNTHLGYWAIYVNPENLYAVYRHDKYPAFALPNLIDLIVRHIKEAHAQ